MPEPRKIFTSQTPLISRYNGTNAIIPAYRVVMKDALYTDGIKPTTGANVAVEGVTLRAIGIGEWGDICSAAGSIVPIQNTGGVTAGDQLMPAAVGDGSVATWTASAGANAAFVGIAQNTAANSAVDEMQFSAPGAFKQG